MRHIVHLLPQAMRFFRLVVLVVTATLAAPVAAHAQSQGALEIGGFGRFTKFADTLRLDAAGGGGGRAGLYVWKNLLAEVELSYADANVTAPAPSPLGPGLLKTVSHTLWASRLTYNHPVSERVRLLLGGGYAYDAYGRVRAVAPRGGGPQGLVGMRYLLTDRLSARVEGTGTYVTPADPQAQPGGRATGLNLGAQAGLSWTAFSRERPARIQYDTVRVGSLMRDTVYVRRIDTVTVAGPAARPIVIGAVNFAFNKSDLTAEAKTVLGMIAASLVDPSNRSRTITVTGNTDAIGGERYNERLGQRRAEQAKAYLVAQGVAADRVVARTQGEGDPLAPNSTDNGRATNRRVLVMLTN